MHPLIQHAPDSKHPGWWTWDLPDDARYNAAIGKLLVQGDGPGRARCRIFPDVPQTNLGNVVHGGAILTFIDMAMFAGGHMAGISDISAVTLDLTTQFISPAVTGEPLDTSVEVIRETGRLAFIRGIAEQSGRPVAAWSGTLRKLSRRK